MLNFVFFPISFGVFSVQGSCDGSTGALCARLSFLLITFGVFAYYESLSLAVTSRAASGARRLRFAFCRLFNFPSYCVSSFVGKSPLPSFQKKKIRYLPSSRLMRRKMYFRSACEVLSCPESRTRAVVDRLATLLHQKLPQTRAAVRSDLCFHRLNHSFSDASACVVNDKYSKKEREQ